MMYRYLQMAATTISLYQSPVPHLISGPPGTGKNTAANKKFNHAEALPRPTKRLYLRLCTIQPRDRYSCHAT